ncbi:MAG: hypothetical protein U1F06_05045 [Steroidobacteraceae bacterium]
MMFRTTALAAAATLCCAAAPAGDLNIGVILAGEISPGVYGQVMIGNQPPPPLLYAQPVIIERVPYGARPAPIYLHVPPGHARNWSKHCREYQACGRPVYFVRSAEYDRDWGGRGRQGRKGHDHHEERGHDD